MGWEEVPNHARHFLQFAIHGANELVLVPMKYGTPLLFRFQVDKVLSIEKAGSVRPVVRAANLAGCNGHFREGCQR